MHKCNLCVKPFLPDTLPATFSPSPLLPHKEELVSSPQCSEKPIIPGAMILSITLYINYILNIYLPNYSLGQASSSDTQVSSTVKWYGSRYVVVGIKRLGHIDSIYFNKYVSYIFNSL